MTDLSLEGQKPLPPEFMGNAMVRKVAEELGPSVTISEVARELHKQKVPAALLPESIRPFVEKIEEEQRQAKAEAERKPSIDAKELAAFAAAVSYNSALAEKAQAEESNKTVKSVKEMTSSEQKEYLEDLRHMTRGQWNELSQEDRSQHIQNVQTTAQTSSLDLVEKKEQNEKKLDEQLAEKYKDLPESERKAKVDALKQEVAQASAGALIKPDKKPGESEADYKRRIDPSVRSGESPEAHKQRMDALEAERTQKIQANREKLLVSHPELKEYFDEDDKLYKAINQTGMAQIDTHKADVANKNGDSGAAFTSLQDGLDRLKEADRLVDELEKKMKFSTLSDDENKKLKALQRQEDLLQQQLAAREKEMSADERKRFRDLVDDPDDDTKRKLGIAHTDDKIISGDGPENKPDLMAAVAPRRPSIDIGTKLEDPLAELMAEPATGVPAPAAVTPQRPTAQGVGIA